MTSTPTIPLRVIKLGGSLLDLSDLPDRFNRYRQFLSEQGEQHLLLIVGGGDAADAVRHYDKQYNLGEHDGHWLAIRAMAFNAHCVARILGDCEIVTAVSDCQKVWNAGKTAVVDPLPWLQGMEKKGFTMPHRWSFTSDSIAAVIAVDLRAEVLTLLKSTLPLTPLSIAQASTAGLVDGDFPLASQGAKRVELVNLRANPPAIQTVQP